MKTVGLDLSSKSGWAVMSGTTTPKLDGYGLVQPNKVISVGAAMEYTLIDNAEKIAAQLLAVIPKDVDAIAIEQTNFGKNRDSQKELEFIHYAVLKALDVRGLREKVIYVDSSRWRSDLKNVMTKEQKDHNKFIKGTKGGVKLEKYRGKVTPKHLSVERANVIYSLDFLLKDNDIADAVNMAEWAFTKRSTNDKGSTLDFDSQFGE